MDARATPLGRYLQRHRSGMAIAAGCVLLLILAGPWLAPHDPYQADILNRLADPSLTHPLGTDAMGRCLLSRLLHGAQLTTGAALLSLCFAGNNGLFELGVVGAVSVVGGFLAIITGLPLSAYWAVRLGFRPKPTRANRLSFVARPAMKLLAWRKMHPALIAGDITFFKCDEPVLAYRRSGEDKDLICVFNLSAEPRMVKLSKMKPSLEPVSHNVELDGTAISLGPNGFAVLSVPVGEGRVSYKAH